MKEIDAMAPLAPAVRARFAEEEDFESEERFFFLRGQSATQLQRGLLQRYEPLLGQLFVAAVLRENYMKTALLIYTLFCRSAPLWITGDLRSSTLTGFMETIRQLDRAERHLLMSRSMESLSMPGTWMFLGEEATEGLPVPVREDRQ